MDFKNLRELKKVVDAHNAHKYRKPVELFNPHMYADGMWGCALVFGKTVDDSEMSDFLLFLYGNGCRFFMGNLNEDMAFYVQ